MQKKKVVVAPNLATTWLIAVATLLSGFAAWLLLIGSQFFPRAQSLEASLAFEIPVLFWLMAFSCFWFPIAGPIMFWSGISTVAFLYLSYVHDGGIESGVKSFFNLYDYFLYSGLFLIINIFVRTKRAPEQES